MTSAQTHTYKTIDGHDILADVQRPAGEEICPVVLFIHGGALMDGHREAIANRERTRLLVMGYATVSIDYRLGPETRLPAIIEDVEDAYTWIVEQGPQLFGIDNTRIAVTGRSAGGYLTLVTGYRCTPRPVALVSFYGYGDLVHILTLSEEQARVLESGTPVSDSRERDVDIGAYYQRCRQLGTWPQAVSGWDPHSRAETFHPYMPAVNVDADYPPTLLIHGTDDTDVPYELSVTMARVLEEHSIEHTLITVDGGEHGLGGGSEEQVTSAHEEAVRFIDRYVRAS